MKTNTKRTTKSTRTKRTKKNAAHLSASAPLTGIDAEIENLAEASRATAIRNAVPPRVEPANDVTEIQGDKLHLIQFARDLRIAAWRGCEEHRGTEVERMYRDECTMAEPETGIVARFQREIGQAACEVPIPVGARAWHLTISGSLSEFDRNLLVRSVFTTVLSADLVHVRPPGDLEGMLHVFVLADAGWRPIGPPAWLREPAANEARLVAPPAKVFPEGVLPHLVRGGR